MGIMDKIFRGKNKNEELNKEDINIQIDPVELEKKVNAMNAELAASLSRKPEVDPFSEVATRINERNQSAAVQNIDNVVQEEAKKAKLEIVEKEFLETHADVEKFRKEFLHNKLLKEMGLANSATQSPCMKKLEALRSSKLVSDRYLDKIFLPYLVEKKLLGIISDKEQQEFDVILGKTGKIEDLKNATTAESYTEDFDNALIILGAIGVIKMRDMVGCKEFPKGKDRRDFRLKKFNLDLSIEAHYLGNKQLADIMLDPKDRKYIMPEEAAKATLSQILNSKVNEVNEAKKVENSELNLEKGEQKID